MDVLLYKGQPRESGIDAKECARVRFPVVMESSSQAINHHHAIPNPSKYYIVRKHHEASQPI